MLIPIADVPRWYAERKPKDTIAISHGADAITWEQLERNANRRARAFAAKGVKPGDFVAIGLPNSNVFFETTFAVWKCGATPTSLTWRLPRGEAAAVLDILKPSLVVGGQPDWNAPNSLPADFVPEGVSDEPVTNPVARYWKAMTSGGSTGRPKVILDHRPAVIDTAGPAALGMPLGASLLNPGPLYHNAPFIVSHTALFHGGRVTGLVKFDAEECLRLIEASRVQWVNFVPTMMHRIWALPDEVRNRYDLSSLQIVFHMAAPMPPWLKEKWIEWLGPERIYELYGGTEAQGATIISGVEWLEHRGSVGKIAETSRLRIIGEDGNEVATGETGEIYFLPNDGAGCTYHYLGFNMRSVIKNPPTMLLVAATIAIVPRIVEKLLLCSPARMIAPTTAMASSALVNDISGVCSSGETRRITSNPMNPASMNTYKLVSRSSFMVFSPHPLRLRIPSAPAANKAPAIACSQFLRRRSATSRE